ncbi:26S proteasome non-ATPase regulatory subunit 14 -like protein [Babesia sp. Xinjiang]|uniref:26S proteasome non-ATPase regulatory subunit 14 -like protein n=1 Tax=Babesia sp. Xinjiang TaxID=462227 RepID=UPI000A25832D|nr:26S proteasome non-ATPase regulatory subunit 14 -like protein [Babesia sp. Xinjiang]XP_028871445.1 26S proteasome non-ATPase regulatory subunit 14 -like protein [Babesia sp. Xinjiang]ORM40840.1 26S proteasome non-ATPase regulatory subunit 14 -like protein [Babesia sp. Xinjiang]ORM40989.1 26S proteasome non-ATPase regulatory subunit 14 -like protein [Babesia sp. Xinjiang]
MGDSGRNYHNLLSSFGGTRHAQAFGPIADTSEQVYISSLALLKMLKHGRAGVPMEVMGLMLGEFIDEYTIFVVDVFSMPQSGNSVSVEAVDPVYQTEMKDQLRRTGRPEVVVGWYHSHPGFGCWFSGTDINTQQSFEQLNTRAVGIVIDPIQSVKGKVVIDCFRLISPHLVMLGQEARQTTSNVGHLNKPTIIALVHGLNRNYYNIVINYRKSVEETHMLMNYHRNKWTEDLQVRDFAKRRAENRETVKNIKELVEKYNESIKQELTHTPEELAVANVGKLNAKMHIENQVNQLLKDNSLDTFGAMLAVEMTGLPVRVPVEYFIELKKFLDCSSADIKGIYERFRHVAPSGFLPLRKFQESLGLLGTLGKLLAENLFFAFDRDADGYLDFAEYARAVLTMLDGSDKSRRELSYRILHISAHRDSIVSMDAENEPTDESIGIDMEAFHRVVNDIAMTRNVLIGEEAVKHTPEHIEKVFRNNATICIDGVSRITPEDFERALVWSNEFMELLGVPRTYCAVEASVVCRSGTPSSSVASGRLISKSSSDCMVYQKSKIYINRTTRRRRKTHAIDTKESIVRRLSKSLGSYSSSRRGLAVYFGHERWNDVINMMVCLGLTARKKYGELTHEITPKDFMEQRTFSISPDNASGNTPSLNFVEMHDGKCIQCNDPNKVVFTEHAPMVFKRLRAMMNLSEEEYIHSVGPEHLVGNMVLGNLSTLSELLSEGKSGALFYFTANGKLVLKTVTKKCAEFVQQWLPQYYEHLKKYPNSLITRFVGLYSMSQCRKRGATTYFIVMNNVFFSSAAIHRRYDLKGSWIGRSLPTPERNDHTVALKDVDMVDFGEYIELGDERSEALFEVLQRDVQFLADSMLMDYSLLLGIHYKAFSGDRVDWNVETDNSQLSRIMGEHRDKLYFVGLVDVLTQWDFRKKAESVWRRLQTFNNPGVSCVAPQQYATRLVDFIKQRTT